MPERKKWGVRRFLTKSVAMATSLEISKKDVQIDHLHTITLSSGEKIAKIGPANLEIIVSEKSLKR